jgi:Asp-tRNA(Asn)/Glu-tRNA(Gln) amidotransferase A subunit family amidase
MPGRYSPSLTEIPRLIAAGRTTPRDLLEASLKAIREQEADVQAWAHLADDCARVLAEKLRDSVARSDLHGVPFAVKDIYDSADLPTEWGTPVQKGRVPTRDCALVAKLLELGAVLVGKTHTTAFAYYDAAPTRNPHKLAHTPGGSSSGSAAAVACGMVPLALGSQTQGSVLRPASFCGVVGFKPTFGKLPLEGVMPFAPTLDHAGLFTSTVADMQVVWQALGYASEADPCDTITSIDWPPPSSPAAEVDAAMLGCLESSLSRLAQSGFRIQHVPRPPFFDDLPEALRTVMYFEAAREHGAMFEEHGAAVGDKLATLLAEGLRISEEDYQVAIASIDEARAAFATWSAENAIIATPAAMGPAPRGLDSTGDPRSNAPFTALGVPAISIPMGSSPDGLPLGLQLVAASGDESRLLATARAIERMLQPEDTPTV